MVRLLTAVFVTGSLTALSASAWAGTIMFGGEIDGSEPTFDNPLTGGTTQTHYDAIPVSVDTTGSYDFLSVYAGDPSIDENLDGYLLLYDAPFPPGTPIKADQDYSAGGIAGLAAFDAACVGQNCSAFSVPLTAGETYVLVQTSFSNTPNSFGQPTGAYDVTITGPGDIAIVPLPAAAWLLICAVSGLGFLRRK